MLTTIVGLLVWLLLMIAGAAMLWLALWLAHGADHRVPALGYIACFDLTWGIALVLELATTARDKR